MSDIVLSKGIRNNLLALQNASALQDKTQGRLATGKKVNTALDDPLAYFQSQTLSTRGKDLGRLLDSIGLGIKTIEAADNGLTAMTRLIEQMQAGLRTALASAATNAKIASGMDATTKRAIDYVTNPNLVGTSAPGAAGPFNAGDQLTLSFSVPSNPSVASADIAVAFTSPMTAQQLVDAINTAAVNNNPATGERYVNASIDAGGRLVIDNSANGTLRMQFTSAGPEPTSLTTLFGTYEPPQPTATTTDTGIIGPVTNPTRAKFAEQYNDMLTQITGLARDSGYHGTNLLFGQTLDMVFNEDASTRLLVRGVVFDAAGLGLTSTDVRRNLQSDVEISAGLAKLGDAIKQIRAQAASFASNNTVALSRQDFTKQAISLLQTGSDNLVIADLNEEGANLLALQTRQQLSTQALSLAAQSDQAILRLFG